MHHSKGSGGRRPLPLVEIQAVSLPPHVSKSLRSPPQSFPHFPKYVLKFRPPWCISSGPFLLGGRAGWWAACRPRALATGQLCGWAAGWPSGRAAGRPNRRPGGRAAGRPGGRGSGLNCTKMLGAGAEHSSRYGHLNEMSSVTKWAFRLPREAN